MTAVTPNAKQHIDLGNLASRFVDVADLPWEKTRFPGITSKTLLVDKSSGVLTVLMRMEPGAELPDHEHVLVEQTYVLEGSLADGEGECTAGNFVYRPAGTRHKAWSPNGGLFLAMFMVPNKFFDKDGGVRDMLGQDWETAWGDAAALRTL